MTDRLRYLLTAGVGGQITYQCIPDELMEKLEAAMAEANELPPDPPDDQCPVCRVMREAGLEVPDFSTPGLPAAPHLIPTQTPFPNRAERRWRARVERQVKRQARRRAKRRAG